jgi:hypothetical protein
MAPAGNKWRAKIKTDAIEHPRVFVRVGFLVNGPSGKAGVPFI